MRDCEALLAELPLFFLHQCAKSAYPDCSQSLLMSLIVTNDICYYLNLPIKSFKNRDAERIFGGEYSRKLPIEIQRRARMKLLQLDSAVVIGDLNLPPSNRLHRLRADRKGQHSLSINNQFRICFVWKDGNAFEVEITDYH